MEHEGKLYVGYTHKSHAANELAVIPIDQLRVNTILCRKQSRQTPQKLPR